ncbi:MAG: translation initiation factor IF-2 subunit gamma, partial [Candidatus Aenigmarchaeota archaeon]|nr:translation initiation factor IF-2 subunit gamma [Candidatus Aenigmarchaeota archaeon]
GYADATFYKCRKCRGSQSYGATEKCINCFHSAKPLRTVSFVDAPGPETLMATVLAGTSIMDGVLLIIGANEPCPQPQTREHLVAMEIAGIKNIVIVQNKIDLVSPQEAKKNHKQIRDFVKGTIAEKAPVIPVSAQQGINIDALIEAIEANIPTPKRDSKKPPKMLVARSFDVNRPGTPIERLKGGILGGSLTEGVLKLGQEIEIRPGIKVKGEFKPVATRVTGLQKSMRDLKEAGPGGLLGVSTGLDPYLTKSDSLSGNVAGLPGKLPPVMQELNLKTNLLERVVGAKEELKVEPIKPGETLMLTISTSRTVDVVSAGGGGNVQLRLKLPVCAEKGDRVALGRQVSGRWRLIGWGQVA